MKSPEIAERILEFVRTISSRRSGVGAPLTPASPLFSSQLVDSMGSIELLAFVEREFGVTMNLPVEELIELDTASGLAERIGRARQG